jgi:hypothetical protein
MKNKILYGLLGVGAIAGFYFFNKNKNKMPKKSKEQIDCENKTNYSWHASGKTCLYNA